jgi:cell division protein FtsW
LVGVGAILVYSASAVRSYDQGGVSEAYLVRHLISIALGLVGMTCALRIPLERWSRHAYLLLGITLLLLVALFVPRVGHRVNGAVRWIPLGLFNFQPAELAKLSVVVYLAHSMAKKREKLRSFSIGFLPHMLVTGIVVMLVLLQPDFGTALIIFATLGLMLFVAGARISYLVLALLLALPVGVHYVSHHPHAWARLLVFLNPEAYRSNIGYQVWESILSFGSGGPFGLGLGEGREKLYFLPEAHTDFIFSVIGEELGFLGALLVIGLFGVLVASGLRVAARAKTRFAIFLAFGISAWFGVQAATNMAVVMALIPTKGLTLPLVSFGGSSMLVTLTAIGILLRITAEERARTAMGP